jgi:putative glycerol-1-phosphate prenyltransferase
MNVFQEYFNRGKKHIAVLLDPDKLTEEKTLRYASIIEKSPAGMIFIGGSLVCSDIEQTVELLKRETSKPVVLFPGSGGQFTPEADALLFLSLISGRNPEYLIGEHVRTAYQIKKSGIETIPTGYILIDGGRVTSVQYVSNTVPIPADKPDLAVSTAVAGELLGLKCLYLEAGSGAEFPVSAAVISAVRLNVSLPLIAGGGLRDMRAVENAFNAGADIAVIGTAFEKNPDFFEKGKIV